MIYDWQERTAMLVGEEMLDHFRNSTVAVTNKNRQLLALDSAASAPRR